MYITSLYYNEDKWHTIDTTLRNGEGVDLVLVFGEPDIMTTPSPFNSLKEYYPNAQIIGASTHTKILSGETSVYDMVATAISFDSSYIKLERTPINQERDLYTTAFNLADKFDKDGLKGILLLSDGLHVNGSTLAKAFNDALPNVAKIGGLASDSGSFTQSNIMANAPAEERVIAAVGFYGDNLSLQSGYSNGWSPFGAKHIVTKSKNNVVMQIDDTPALDFYRKYLGSFADELPEIGLRFPLSIETTQGSKQVFTVRTLLGIDEKKKLLIFAGDVPQNSKIQLMLSTNDKLIDEISELSQSIKPARTDSIAISISCIGRKLILNDFSNLEVRKVQQILGNKTTLIGFYSNGEIVSDSNDILHCSLHNQTMTVGVITETI